MPMAEERVPRRLARNADEACSLCQADTVRCSYVSDGSVGTCPAGRLVVQGYGLHSRNSSPLLWEARPTRHPSGGSWRCSSNRLEQRTVDPKAAGSSPVDAARCERERERWYIHDRKCTAAAVGRRLPGSHQTLTGSSPVGAANLLRKFVRVCSANSATRLLPRFTRSGGSQVRSSLLRKLGCLAGTLGPWQTHTPSPVRLRSTHRLPRCIRT